jgi:hypothetical protein
VSLDSESRCVSHSRQYAARRAAALRQPRRPLTSPIQALKALHLSHEAPAYVSATDCDALLLGLGLPLSKLVHLDVEFDERGPLERGSLYSKTKAAHR